MSAPAVGEDALDATMLARVDDIPPQGKGALRQVIGETLVGLFRLGEEIVAWRDVCPHEAAPVCRGEVAGTRLLSEVSEYSYGRHQEILRCPWHGWEFDLTTGRHIAEGSGARLRQYPIEVRDGAVYDASRRGLLHTRELLVQRATSVGRTLVLDLAAADGGPLPAWSPGAHLELSLPSGLIRHYSLCGNERDREQYRIAVLRESDGRGGSVEVHRIARPGATVTMRAIRNRFPLRYAPHYLFLAAGIGVTPILPMVRSVARRGAPYRAYYIGHGREHAFAEEFGELAGAEVIDTSQQGRPDLGRLIETCPAGTMVYCCGPQGFIEAVERAAADRPLSLQTEVFTPTAAAPAADAKPFEVTLARTGPTIGVGAEETILQALRRHGIAHGSSCEDGWCGSCESTVLEGNPLHHDTVLDEDERESGESMMVCVSRAAGNLVLDL